MDIDLPGFTLNIKESETVKKTKFFSQDIAMIMNFQSKIRAWRKRAKGKFISIFVIHIYNLKKFVSLFTLPYFMDLLCIQ